MQFDVIIPAYNSSKTLSPAISSAWSCGASQVIVVDDGSSDNTASIAKSMNATVIHQDNAGPASARSRGVETSNAELVVFLDADDELIADGIKRSLHAMSKDESLSAVGGGIVGLLPNGESRVLSRTHSGYLSPSQLITTGHGPWPPGAAVIRRKAYMDALQCGPPALNPRYAEDYELFIRLALCSNILAHDVPALKYKMYSGRSSSEYLAPVRDEEQVCAYYAHALSIPRESTSNRGLKSSSFRRATRTKWAQGHRMSAIIYFTCAIAVEPEKLIVMSIKRLPRILGRR